MFFALYMNLATDWQYHGLMKNTKGDGTWSAAIYSLADTLETHYKDRPIRLMDWGFGNPLYLLSAGRLQLHEDSWKFRTTSEPSEKLIRLVSDPINVFIVHSAPHIIYPTAYAALYRAAWQAGVSVKTKRPIFDSRGNEMYTIVEFIKHPTKSGESSNNPN